MLRLIQIILIAVAVAPCIAFTLLPRSIIRSSQYQNADKEDINKNIHANVPEEFMMNVIKSLSPSEIQMLSSIEPNITNRGGDTACKGNESFTPPTVVMGVEDRRWYYVVTLPGQGFNLQAHYYFKCENSKDNHCEADDTSNSSVHFCCNQGNDQIKTMYVPKKPIDEVENRNGSLFVDGKPYTDYSIKRIEAYVPGDCACQGQKFIHTPKTYTCPRIMS